MTPLTQSLKLALAGALLIHTMASAVAQQAAPLSQAQTPSTLEIKGFRIQAEVARTPQARATGLMGRLELAQDSGMLFVFDAPERICMWMRNTPLPLSVAFLDERGVIVNIENMKPLSDTVHCAKSEARYALEMTQGWFVNRGIQPRDQVRLVRP
jgi:uncharacterized membrane protein (UPF0127 family)